MKRALLIVAAIFMAGSLAAQTTGGFSEFPEVHQKGDRMIALNIGAGVPLFILPQSAADTKAPMGVGASFGLGYHQFLADGLSLGGTLVGAFNGTVGGRTLFMAPLAARLGYWWGKPPLEFSTSLDLGLNIMRLSGNGMITPFVRAAGGFHRQVTDDWSIGADVAWWFIPELHFGSSSSLTRYGNFLEISIGTLYHF